MEKILIGKGALSWNRSERVTDRYGAVNLWNKNANEKIITSGAYLDIKLIKAHEGKKGSLICEVIEIRESTHIGDLFHGFHPNTPELGAEIILGEGELFYHRTDGIDSVGLKPLPPRWGTATFWLDPEKLYNTHEQTVNLYFKPSN